MNNLAIGVDIGGSHITCQLFDLNTNSLLKNSKIRVDVYGNDSKESILQHWVEAIQKITANQNLQNLAGIGFAMPGPFDYENGIAWFDNKVGKFHSLHGVDVKKELLQRLRLPDSFPLRFLNDAASFAVGEASVEPVSKYNRIIAITLGTGFGTTFIKDGQPIAGKYGVPDDGFLYHVPFRNSIADDYFSTRWFLNEYKNNTGLKIKGVKELSIDAESNTKAREYFRIFGENLGEFLSPWIVKFGAECIIIGGNISKSISLFKSEMKNQFPENDTNISIYSSKLDEDAALVGSARLCDDKFYFELINNK